MGISFIGIEIGNEYDRPQLADIWGYESYHAISRGIITPAESNVIILFVTEEKQDSLPQYQDVLEGDTLHMEGEKGHGNDHRLINAKKNGEVIHLFHRQRHHSPFIYYGKLRLHDYKLRVNRPSKFVFKLSNKQ